MKQLALTLLCLLLPVGVAAADEVRMEIGLGGVFPAGGWTRCRISGLDVEDGGVIIVNVAEAFERRLTVSGGVAEGLVLMVDEAPIIALEVPGKGRVAVPPDQLRHLRGVKDRLPVVFVGRDTPGEAAVRRVLGRDDIFPIRVTPGEFFAQSGRNLEWVRVFVLGEMDDDQLKQLRSHFTHLSTSVLLAKAHAVRDWLARLDFRKAGELIVYNAELAEFLPVPQGSVRGDLYEIFGPPEWPASARRNIVLCFVGVLALFAVAAVFPGKTRAMRVYRVVFPAAFAVFLVVLAAWRISAPVESVALWEGAEGGRLGVRTEILSTAVLRSGAGESSKTDIVPVPEYVPVASRPGQWVEQRLVLDEQNRLVWQAPARSRRVFWSRVVVTKPPEEPGRWIETDGSTVWPVPPRYGGGGQSFAEYVAERHDGNARREELRDAAMRWWLGGRPRGRAFRIGWTEAGTDGAVFSAGTMVVIRTGALAAGVYLRGLKILRDDWDAFGPRD